MPKCGCRTEVFSRVCGYHRPVRNWNRGKQEEFSEREPYRVPSMLELRADDSDAGGGDMLSLPDAHGKIKGENNGEII